MRQDGGPGDTSEGSGRLKARQGVPHRAARGKPTDVQEEEPEVIVVEEEEEEKGDDSTPKVVIMRRTPTERERAAHEATDV